MSAAFRIALFGQPVGHSRSAELFSALADAGGPRVEYEPVDVSPEGLPGRLDELRRGRWVGANVTIPHKIAAAELADRLVGDARLAGAVNVLIRDGGQLIGANTDGSGLVSSLPRVPRRALLMGGGGAARGVAAALTRSGATIAVLSRSPRAVSSGWRRLAAEGLFWDDARLAEVVRSVDLVVQATPLGMEPQIDAVPPLPLEHLRPGQLIVDLIYRPWETLFLREVRARGLPALNGWPMLLGQAAAALELWLGPGHGRTLEAAARRLETRDPWSAPPP